MMSNITQFCLILLIITLLFFDIKVVINTLKKNLKLKKVFNK